MHSHIHTHSHAHSLTHWPIVLYLCNFQYIIIRIFVLLGLCFFLHYSISLSTISQYPSAHIHLYTYTSAHGAELAAYYWTHECEHYTSSSPIWVFCVLWCYFFSFLSLPFVMLVYIHFHWSCCFSLDLCENFFGVRCFFLAIHSLHTLFEANWMCPYSGSLCVLRSHANITPFIYLNLINSWSY